MFSFKRTPCSAIDYENKIFGYRRRRGRSRNVLRLRHMQKNTGGRGRKAYAFASAYRRRTFCGFSARRVFQLFEAWRRTRENQIYFCHAFAYGPFLCARFYSARVQVCKTLRTVTRYFRERRGDESFRGVYRKGNESRCRKRYKSA